MQCLSTISELQHCEIASETDDRVRHVSLTFQILYIGPSGENTINLPRLSGRLTDCHT